MRLEESETVAAKHPRRVVVVLLLLLAAIIAIGTVAYGLAYIRNPFKVTDPTDPRFIAASFDPADYPKTPDRQEAFRAVIPAGMPRQDAERTIAQCCEPIEISNIELGDNETTAFPTAAYEIRYIYRPWIAPIAEVLSLDGYNWRIFVTYDEQDRVVYSTIHGP